MSWTITELQNRVEEALHVEPASVRGDGDGRVSAVPNARTIRYYTTEGLVGKPALEGGQALYGRRHLLQVLAVKRLQAARHGLASIREQLEKLSDRKLTRIARLPSEDQLKKARDELNEERQHRFWAKRPAGPDVGPCFTTLRGLELDAGVTLTFKVSRDLCPQDVEQLNEAAQPLLETLRDLGLLP